jgi:hypothetical protein
MPSAKRNMAVIIVAVIGILLLSQQSNLFSIGGTVLSLSQTNFVSNDPTIGGQAWLLTMSVNGQGQYAEGYFNSITADGKTSKYPLTVKVSNDAQTCTYPINTGSQKIYTAEYKTADYQAVLDDAQAWARCGQLFGTNDLFLAQKFQGSLIIGCTYRHPVAQAGTIGTATLNFAATISSTVNGVMSSATLTNQNQRSAWVGNNVYASWSGNLGSGETCPSASGQGIAAIYQNGWNSVDSAKVTQFVALDANLKTCMAAVGNKQGECIDPYNAVANAALYSSKRLTSDGGTTASAGGSLSSGQVTLPLSRMLAYPVITMRIKADYLGVVIPVGIPKINSVSSPAFYSGTTGTISATISNIGDGDGSFAYSAVCSSPFQATGTSQSISVSKGQSQTVFIPITVSATGSQDTSGTCTVNVYDLNNANNKDVATVTVIGKPIAVCSPVGQLICTGNVIQECIGSGYRDVQICANGCEAAGASTKCKDKPVPPCTSNQYFDIDSNKCVDKGPGTDYLLWVIVIGGLVIGLIAGSKMGGRKKR